MREMRMFYTYVIRSKKDGMQQLENVVAFFKKPLDIGGVMETIRQHTTPREG